MKIKSNIGRIIKDSGLRDEFIAKKVGGVTKKTIYYWKNSLSYPTFEKSFVLAKVLGCKVDDLAEVIEEDNH